MFQKMAQYPFGVLDPGDFFQLAKGKDDGPEYFKLKPGQKTEGNAVLIKGPKDDLGKIFKIPDDTTVIAETKIKPPGAFSLAVR